MNKNPEFNIRSFSNIHNLWNKECLNRTNEVDFHICKFFSCLLLLILFFNFMFVKNLLLKNRLCACMKYVTYNFIVVTFQIVRTYEHIWNKICRHLKSTLWQCSVMEITEEFDLAFYCQSSLPHLLFHTAGYRRKMLKKSRYNIGKQW